MMGDAPTASATLAAKFCTTRLVMLCESGVVSWTALRTAGTSVMTSSASLGGSAPSAACRAKGGGDRTLPSSDLASLSASAAAITALTTATPARDLAAVLLWYRTRCTLEALMPPMQTAGTLRE